MSALSKAIIIVLGPVFLFIVSLVIYGPYAMVALLLLMFIAVIVLAIVGIKDELE